LPYFVGKRSFRESSSYRWDLQDPNTNCSCRFYMAGCSKTRGICLH